MILSKSVSLCDGKINLLEEFPILYFDCEESITFRVFLPIVPVDPKIIISIFIKTSKTYK